VLAGISCFYMAGLSPAKILRGGFSGTTGNARIRKALGFYTIFHFGRLIVLTISAFSNKFKLFGKIRRLRRLIKEARFYLFILDRGNAPKKVVF